MNAVSPDVPGMFMRDNAIVSVCSLHHSICQMVRQWLNYQITGTGELPDRLLVHIQHMPGTVPGLSLPLGPILGSGGGRGSVHTVMPKLTENQLTFSHIQLSNIHFEINQEHMAWHLLTHKSAKRGLTTVAGSTVRTGTSNTISVHLCGCKVQ